MSTSAEWIDKLLRKMIRRFSPPDFPKPGTDEFDDLKDDWIDALGRRNATEAEAEEALRRLREDPPSWLREMLPKLIAAVEAIRRERVAKGEANDKDSAQSASRNCEHCSGSGQAMVFDPKYDGRRVVDRDCLVRGEVKVMPFPMTVSAHCVCAMGRWMRSKIRDLDTLARTPDLTEVLAGRSRWLAADPTGDTPGHEYRGDWRRMKRELAERIGGG